MKHVEKERKYSHASENHFMDFWASETPNGIEDCLVLLSQYLHLLNNYVLWTNLEK